ncbi:MAG: type IV toxin-antitoxin system AbiEi family antitoxin domain-containing protein [Candidatus Thiodiazotropha sp. (ex Ctena orbiculata)]|nr:type IV toxin-antitoxin system AbiEi family antitoxin domain-containing protein [Candidatus Thiodiazotropha taylori]
MKVQAFFNEHPVFRHESFVTFLERAGSSRTKTREALLAYHVKAGHLLRLRRGLYAVVPQGLDPMDYPVDPYLLAGHLTADAVLSHHSALQFHGKAYSVHHRFTYLTRNARRPFVFRGQEFVAVPFPKALQAQQAELFGVETHKHAGGQVRVTNLERTMVDVLVRPALGGGWEEVWRSLELVEYFNLDQVTDYVLMLHSATAAAKVGFFFEQHREALMVDDARLELLRKHVPKQPCYLDRSRRESGKLVSSWRLVVPPAVLERTWEEGL